MKSNKKKLTAQRKKRGKDKYPPILGKNSQQNPSKFFTKHKNINLCVIATQTQAQTQND